MSVDGQSSMITGDGIGRDVMRRFNTMDSYRQRWNPLWQQASDLMGNANFFTYNNSYLYTAGNDQTFKYYDSSPILYRHLYTAMLMGYGTNPMTKWFNLKLADNEEPEDDTLRWLEQERDFLLDRFSNDGLYNCLLQSNKEYADYGNGIIFMSEKEDDGDEPLSGFRGFRFQAVPLQDSWFTVNGNGKIKLYWTRRFMTAYEAYDFFGDNADALPEEVKKARMKMDQYSRFAFINEVMPVENGPKRYRSVWVAQDSAKTVKIGGYDEFPFIVYRAMNGTGEIYGRGKTIDFLATIKEQNHMTKSLDYAVDYRTRPWIWQREGTKVDYRNIRPAAFVTYSGQEPPTPMEWKGQLDFMDWKYKTNDQFLRMGYFVNQLDMDMDKAEYAKAETIVAKTKASKIALGPEFVHQESELIKPLINRAVRIHVAAMTDKEKRSLPAQLLENGGKLDCEVCSPMAKAQQEVDLQAMNSGLGYIMQLLPVYPELRDIMNPDKIAANYVKYTNTPLSNFRKPQEIEMIRKVKQQIQMQQQQIQALAQTAPAVKDLADARAQTASIQ